MSKTRTIRSQMKAFRSGGGLGVFGSYARGEATEGSDIDIAVDITGPMGLSFIAMADEIEELFGIKTDVVPKRSIKEAYLANVEKDIIYV